MSTKTYNYCGCFMHRVFLGLVAPYNEQCPELCGTDLFIIGISNSYTVDGWYLEEGGEQFDPNIPRIVYLEGGVITDAIICPGRIAAYGHVNGLHGGYEFPHYLGTVQGEGWLPLIEVVIQDLGSFDYQFTVYQSTIYPWGTSTGVIQISTDNGATWVDMGTFPDDLGSGSIINYNTGTNSFLYRTIITDGNGCQYYNPAPPENNVAVTYFILDDQFLNQFDGWTFDGTDLLDWRNNVLPTLPNFLFDASVAESGDSLYVSFIGVNHPNIVVIDSLANPVTLNWQTIITTVPCLTTTFTVVDPTDTIIQYLMIGNYVLPSSSLPVTDPQCAVEIQNIFIGHSFGTTTTVNISVVGNDVTLTVHGSNGLITGIRWSDSLFNTGDSTFTTC